MAADMVFNKLGHAVWCDTPSKTKRYLRYRLKDNSSFLDYTVRIGKTMKTVTVPEYLGIK